MSQNFTLTELGEIVAAYEEAYDLGYLDGKASKTPDFYRAIASKSKNTHESVSYSSQEKNLIVKLCRTIDAMVNDLKINMPHTGYFNEEGH